MNVEEGIEPGDFSLSRFVLFIVTSHQIVDLCCIHSFLGLMCMGGVLH